MLQTWTHKLEEPSIDDPRLARLHALWTRWRDEAGEFPPRSVVDPFAIPPDILPTLMLVTVEPERRFLMRLVGTTTAQGIDPTGRYLNDAAPEGPYRDHIVALFGSALDEQAPVYTVTDYADEKGVLERRVHRVFLPLSDAGEMIDGLLIGQATHSVRLLTQSLWQAAPEEMSVRRRDVLT